LDKRVEKRGVKKKRAGRLSLYERRRCKERGSNLREDWG